MKHSAAKLPLLLATLGLSFSHLLAQVPSIQLKVREPRLLGLSGERFARIELSNQMRAFPLTSDNVASGEYYYFLFRPAGTWTLDADYVKEELQKLKLYQDGQTYPIAWKGEVITDTAGMSILVGFSRELRLHQLFLVQFQLREATSQAEFKVPQEYWPGYSTVIGALDAGRKASEEKKYRETIATSERALENDTLEIFPQYVEIRDMRVRAFRDYSLDRWSAFVSVFVADNLPLKEKIARMGEFTPVFRFVADSLPNARLNFDATDPAIKPLIDQARDAAMRTVTVRDSLQLVLDEQNVRWIIEGGATGKTGYLYQYMVEALAYAFSSLDFADTTRGALKVTLPEEIEARLAKYELSESYETFIRQCGERLNRHTALFPPEFLNNLQKDSGSFALPIYSMLRAVNDFSAGNLAGAKEEIFKVFRTSYDTELSGRLDQMRVVINLHEQGISADVMRILDEASAAEKAGNNALASERYREASRIAPDVAYAAYLWGKFFARTGDPIRALTFLERAYQLDTLYLSAYREAYSLYRKSGNFKPMIDVLTRALARGNDYWEIHYNLGVAYMGDGDLARAIAHFEQALALSPNSYQTNIQVGLAHQTAKNYQKAREYFNRAINIDPVRQDAVNFLDKLNELQKAAR
ncbi:MAG: tetratricopeptide repeat protein [Ignavibacteria bacterium]|nr:tetratricopeptide repeat protein [Ignavibacteria bacterium]